MPPMMFTTLVSLLFNLLMAGVMPDQTVEWTKRDGAVRFERSATL